MKLDEEIAMLNKYIRKAEKHGTTDNKHYFERVQMRDWLVELREIKGGGENVKIN